MDYYSQIKDLINDTEATIRVKVYTKNKVILENYYEIGRLIVEAQGGEERLISTPDSSIKVYVIPTDEEVMIARDTYRLANK